MFNFAQVVSRTIKTTITRPKSFPRPRRAAQSLACIRKQIQDKSHPTIKHRLAHSATISAGDEKSACCVLSVSRCLPVFGSIGQHLCGVDETAARYVESQTRGVSQIIVSWVVDGIGHLTVTDYVFCTIQTVQPNAGIHNCVCTREPDEERRQTNTHTPIA